MLRTRVQRLLYLCIRLRLRLPMRCGLRLIDGVHSVSGMLRLWALRQVESVRARSISLCLRALYIGMRRPAVRLPIAGCERLCGNSRCSLLGVPLSTKLVKQSLLLELLLPWISCHLWHRS
jgi:hypothetical protein